MDAGEAAKTDVYPVQLFDVVGEGVWDSMGGEMKRLIDYLEAISEGWAFVLIAFVGLLFLGIFCGEGARWSTAFALCGGLVWGGLWAGKMHFMWALETSRHGWDDWARKERIGLYSWLALGLTGLIMGIIALMGK